MTFDLTLHNTACTDATSIELYKTASHKLVIVILRTTGPPTQYITPQRTATCHSSTQHRWDVSNPTSRSPGSCVNGESRSLMSLQVAQAHSSTLPVLGVQSVATLSSRIKACLAQGV
ncbi:hypothetical protein BD311DRAFT_288128 [Dichomitus squalens]|uniref:Uncharacterized protein n=1 Tax=Dichomitus squalens TaxID=114155 RepID=A0A4Q9N6T3_9APHY|nr:hypothetical protein BD311DRAFT_288128 [Dichomitus squalens]